MLHQRSKKQCGMISSIKHDAFSAAIAVDTMLQELSLLTLTGHRASTLKTGNRLRLPQC